MRQALQIRGLPVGGGVPDSYGSEDGCSEAPVLRSISPTLNSRSGQTSAGHPPTSIAPTQLHVVRQPPNASLAVGAKLPHCNSLAPSYR